MNIFSQKYIKIQMELHIHTNLPIHFEYNVFLLEILLLTLETAQCE